VLLKKSNSADLTRKSSFLVTVSSLLGATRCNLSNANPSTLTLCHRHSTASISCDRSLTYLGQCRMKCSTVSLSYPQPHTEDVDIQYCKHQASIMYHVIIFYSMILQCLLFLPTWPLYPLLESSHMSFCLYYVHPIVAAKVPGLLVPKTFRSQERIVPMGNFRSGDFSFPGTFVPPTILQGIGYERRQL